MKRKKSNSIEPSVYKGLNYKKLSVKFDDILNKVTKEDFEKWELMDNLRSNQMENKITKEFLQTFIDSLSKLSNNQVVFPNSPNRQISLWLLKKVNDTMIHARVEFFENGYGYVIYAADFDTRDESIYEKIYLEVLIKLFFSVDSIGILQNQKGEKVDIITAQSLFNGMLTKLKNP